MQDIGVALRRRGNVVDFGYACGDMVRDSQSRHDVDAPRSAKITQFFEVCH
jgi:hypothetical protein